MCTTTTTIAKAVKHFANITDEYGELVQFNTTLVLHKIGGNKAAHFSATLSGTDMRGKCYGSFAGCNHTLLLAAWPAASIVVNLHLIDSEGIPMYANENGFYYYEIFTGTAVYHDYKKDDGSKWLDVLFRHLRISTEAGKELVKALNNETTQQGKKLSFAAFCEKQRPRWKAEAAAARAFIEVNA